MGIERKTRVEPGISRKVTIIDGTALLVLTFKEEELDLNEEKVMMMMMRRRKR